jgi:C-terminal processing protease CtpA/Prc
LTSFIIGSKAQTEQKFNLGFEKQSNLNELSDGWFKWGTYDLKIDSLSESGQKSGKITSTDNGHFGSIAYRIPANYSGKTIVLEGYMKIKNVENGFAGLLLRVDGNNQSLAFDNMQNQNISGTKDWQKYSIELDYPKNADNIYIAGILSGKGEAWFDDFVLLIDGKNVQTLKEIDKPVFKASLDKEFDKGSGITYTSVDKNQIENLKTLGLIWGFLKYYHPNIAKGEYNWDYELFRILPKVQNSGNKIKRDEILVQWIKNFGPFEEGKMNKTNTLEIKTEPDLNWIDTLGFSEELKAVLLKVKNAGRPGDHYYIGLKPGVRNPVFKNENTYAEMKYPDTGFRLLTLYRYWNIIQYYFPYKNLIEEDWKNVLEEYIPKFISAKNETDYTLVVLELIGRVHDTHANIWGGNQILNSYLGLNYSPVELKFIENRPVVTAYYDESLGKETGLEIGDIITMINHQPIEEIIAASLKYTPASNYSTQLRDIAPKLLRTNDTIIHIEFERDGKKVNKTIKTYSSNKINIYKKYQVKDTCFKLIDKDIAYINNGSLKRDYLPTIWNVMKDTKGLIIDIRNYPSDFPIYDLSSYLMPKNTPFVKFTKGSIENPGLFTYTSTIDAGKQNNDYYKGKVLILINEISQSSAEFHAMAYRVNPNATVIGSTTAGADGNVSQISLPGGISTMISGIGVYYPNGKETQRIGIIPDIELSPTIKGIKKGKDELLDKAIDVINGQ